MSSADRIWGSISGLPSRTCIPEHKVGCERYYALSAKNSILPWQPSQCHLSLVFKSPIKLRLPVANLMIGTSRHRYYLRKLLRTWRRAGYSSRKQKMQQVLCCGSCLIEQLMANHFSFPLENGHRQGI